VHLDAGLQVANLAGEVAVLALEPIDQRHELHHAGAGVTLGNPLRSTPCMPLGTVGRPLGSILAFRRDGA
jgi:hypothetical protein